MATGAAIQDASDVFSSSGSYGLLFFDGLVITSMALRMTSLRLILKASWSASSCAADFLSKETDAEMCTVFCALERADC